MFDFDVEDLLNDPGSNAWDHLDEELRKRAQVHAVRTEMAVATREFFRLRVSLKSKKG